MSEIVVLVFLTASGDDAGSLDPSPVVIQSSIGPFDYAVLKADKRDEMLAWLAKNHYFVPAGTDQVVATIKAGDGPWGIVIKP